MGGAYYDDDHDAIGSFSHSTGHERDANVQLVTKTHWTKILSFATHR